MACQLGDFEGTWTVVRGLRKDSRLVVEKNGAQYSLSEEGGGVLQGNLSVDNVAFTLKNTAACLSLFWDCGYLFGIEQIGTAYEVWGAVRNENGSSETSELSLEEPDWRLGEPWIVQARTGQPPVGYDDRVIINENTPVEPLPYTIGVENEDPFDELLPNDLNRSLDSDIRTVASWRREAPAKPFIFAMVIVPEPTLEQLEPYLSDIGKVKEILRQTGWYLRFEIDMLAEGLIESQSSIGVWGAEEG